MDNTETNVPTDTPSARRLKTYVWAYPVAFLFALTMLGCGVFIAVRKDDFALLAAGAASLALVVSLWPLAMAYAAGRVDAANAVEEKLGMISERFEQFSIMLDQISEQQLISERAKSVAFREKERDALRRAIQEECAKQDWEAALILANEMEQSFGYRNEADRFRHQINLRHNEALRRQINEAIGVIDKHIRAEQWGPAVREAERVMLAYPGDEQVQSLPVLIEQRRQSHKNVMLDRWRDCIARNDNDGAIEILKKLDVYLSPSEAEAMQETVRGVFKEKLNSLRTQFALAVQEHRWPEAIRIGEVVTRDFPNTQMAKEVVEVMESLKQRAGEGGALQTA